MRGDDMGLNTLLDSKIARHASTLSMLGEAVLSWSRGDRRMGVLFLVASVLAYRWSTLGVVTEVGIRLYRRMR